MTFFTLWLLILAHATLRPPRAAWIEQLLAVAFLCLALPLLNWLVVGDQLISYLQRGDGERAGVELVAIVIGLFCLWGARRLSVKRQRITSRTSLRKTALSATSEVGT